MREFIRSAQNAVIRCCSLSKTNVLLLRCIIIHQI